LDEPTAGLDPLSSEVLKEKIIAEKKRNKLVLITSHVLSELDELTTHVMYLQEGKLQFFKNVETLREETGELKLGRAIAQIMKDDLDNKWVNKLFEVKNRKE
jgi:Cu-processing system ATP-binding protein